MRLKLKKEWYEHLADMEKDCASVEAGSEQAFINHICPRKENVAEAAKRIKDTAKISYKENMTKEEAKELNKANEETNWNRLFLSILRLAADRKDTLVILWPNDGQKLCKKLRFEGFKVKVEKVPTGYEFGPKTEIRSVTVTW
jgi:hypothetical protein